MKVFNNLHAFVWQSMTANNCNAYFIDGPTRILIDPGHRALFEHVQQGLRQLNLGINDIDIIICTHAHPDHLEGVQLFEDSPSLFTLHQDEWQWVATIGKQMTAAFGIDLEEFQPDFFLREGKLSLDGLELGIFHTPGHSPGSITVYWPLQKTLFTGDLVFKDGIGRTDLPGGNGVQIKESIERMMALDVEWLLPGHGDFISGAKDVQRNFQHIEQFWFRYI